MQKKIQKNMKAIESYWKDTAALWEIPWADYPHWRFLTALQVIMHKFIRPNENAFFKKMRRVHQKNVFHIHRSLHLIFGW